MGTMQRLIQVVRATVNAVLNRVEDPTKTLDLAYEDLIAGLQSTKRSLADVAAQASSLQRQVDEVDASVARAEENARLALRSGREDLARAALVEKQAALGRRESLIGSATEIRSELERLVEYERRQEASIGEFRSRKEMMNARYAASKAQVRAVESLTGLDDRLLGSGDAIRRAEEKVNSVRDRAAALDGMSRRGLLRDVGDGRSTTERDIADLRSQTAVEDELARLKAEQPKRLTS